MSILNLTSGQNAFGHRVHEEDKLSVVSFLVPNLTDNRQLTTNNRQRFKLKPTLPLAQNY